jgi:hypothetical protein
VGQSSIALLIFAPAPINLSPIESQSLIVPGSFRVISWQGISFLLIPGDLFLQLVNVSAGASLPAIEATGVQEEWPADLFAVFINGSCCQ